MTLTKASDTSRDGTLATLMEPVLLGLGHNWMRFRGIEAVPTSRGKAGVVPEWLVELTNE